MNIYLLMSHDCSLVSPLLAILLAQDWSQDHIFDGLCIILVLLVATLLGFDSVSDLRIGVVFSNDQSQLYYSHLTMFSGSYLLSVSFLKKLSCEASLKLIGFEFIKTHQIS